MPHKDPLVAKEYRRARYQRLKEHMREPGRLRMAKWRKCNADKVKEQTRRDNLKQHFGITVEQYDSMLLAQGGVCAICALPENGKRLAVDHCHVTNKVRGLLCQKCNRGIGYLKDDVGLLSKAISYLREASGAN